eukprot:FR743389.1.p1 GENE.FR743389.1~~FR743389.1.p1  ORF type:complete len:269 (+),score=36.13 FR743389.1:55-861(+)
MASRHVWFVLTGIMMLTTRRECATAFTGVGSVRRHVDLDRMLTASRRTAAMRARRDDFDEFEDFDEYSNRDRDNFGPPPARRGGVSGGGGGLSTLIPKGITQYLLAGIFVLGIGTGVTIDSAINTDEKDLASRDAIDRAAPNRELCVQYGSSAMVMDQRVFVTFNPFNVYVTQADAKPGCVLRSANVVSVLQERKLLESNEVTACKNNMNTWAFVGDLDDRPQISCVYKSKDAQNEFLSNPKIGLGEDIYDNDATYKPDTSKQVKRVD